MAAVFGNRAFFNGNYALRAVAAQLGWGGNDQIEAFYPIGTRSMLMAKILMAHTLISFDGKTIRQ